MCRSVPRIGVASCRYVVWIGVVKACVAGGGGGVPP